MTTPDEGRILEVNDAFLRILGYRREEVTGRTVAEVGAWGFRVRRDGWLRELRQRGTLQNVEAEVTTKRGDVRVGLVSRGLLEIEGHERVLTVIMDITERKRAEEALRLSEERFMQTFRSCPAAMALSRVHDGCFVDVNEAFVKMTGYRREDVVGRSVGIWKRPDDRKAAVRELLAAGSLRDCEYDFSRKSGETIHGLGAAELVDVGGERLILSLVLDITARKQAEEELRHALADKETLIREVHHRVKNNLQILCDLLFLQGELLQGEEGKAAIEDASRRVFAIARLHEQLYHSLQRGQVNLGEYLGRLISGFEALAPGVRIVLEAPDPAVLMDVDRAIHTGLIVSELVTNALKHAFPKDGTGQVCVRLRAAGDEVELQVEDDGRGLPPDLDVGRAPSLGLRIVDILCRKLGAVLETGSGPGARFTVRFPRQPLA